MIETIEIEIDGIPVAVELFTKKAPKTCRALLEQLPLKVGIIHSRLSGALCVLRRIHLANAPLENPVSLLGSGDIGYHPTHYDMAIAYEPTQFRELAGSVYISLFGRLTGDLSTLTATGRALPHTGELPVVFRA